MAMAINIPLQESVLFSMYSDIILSSVSHQIISITSNLLTLGVDLEPKTILRLKIFIVFKILGTGRINKIKPSQEPYF